MSGPRQTPISPQLSFGGFDTSQRSTQYNSGTMSNHFGANIGSIVINNNYYCCSNSYHNCQTRCQCVQERDNTNEISILRDDASVSSDTSQSEYFTAEFSSFASFVSIEESGANGTDLTHVNMDDPVTLPTPSWGQQALSAPQTQVAHWADNVINMRLQFIWHCDGVIKELRRLSEVHPFVNEPVVEFRAVVTLGLYCRKHVPRVFVLYQEMCNTISVLLKLLHLRDREMVVVLKKNMHNFLQELTNVIKRCGSFCDLHMKPSVGNFVKRIVFEQSFEDLCDDLLKRRQDLEHVIDTFTIHNDVSYSSSRASSTTRKDE